jgi:ankyrin repeat protein
VKLLLAAGANVNTKGADGWTALIYASWRGHEATTKLLIAAGAASEIDATSLHGSTALLDACDGGHEGVAKLLLAAGADPNIADSLGNTPLAAAKRRGNSLLESMLRSAGAKG